MDNQTIDSSFKYCEVITKSHYENFPVASLLLPKDKRNYIYAVYAFSRTADDYADEEKIGSDKRRLELINNWENNLNECLDDNTDNPVFIALCKTIRDKNIPSQLFKDLLTAFRQDIVKKRYENFDELLDYCRNSANPVGRIILQIFDVNDDDAFRYSDHICTALQLTNFWQDVLTDLNIDRIYIPMDDMKKFNYDIEMLKGRVQNENFHKLMGFQIDRTRTYFKEGRKLIKLLMMKNLSKRFVTELKLTILGGEKILEKIESGNYNILNKRPKLNKFDIFKLLIKTNTSFDKRTA